MELALDKPSRINIGGIITLIWGPVIFDCFSLSPWSFANTWSGVFVFFFRLLITSMWLSLRLRRRRIKVTGRVALVISSALLSFELLSITIWRLCWWRRYWVVLMWGGFSARLLALLSVLICSLPWLRILLVEITGMRESLCSRCVIVAEVGFSVFSLELLCTTAWAVLHLARRLMEAAGGAVVVWLPESLFLLSSPICLFPRSRRRLVKGTGPKVNYCFCFCWYACSYNYVGA